MKKVRNYNQKKAFYQTTPKLNKSSKPGAKHENSSSLRVF